MRKNSGIRFLTMVLLAAMVLAACSPGPARKEINVTSDSLYVQRVENLPDDFIMGMDASCVPALENSGVKYYDFDGTEKDVYEILSDNGINYEGADGE